MMEGISSEAFSLAGTLGLSKLIVFYDSNQISIEGSTDIAFTENVEQRMAAFGFQTLTVEDGNDLFAIGKAIEAAKADKERPSFITVKTQIDQMRKIEENADIKERLAALEIENLRIYSELQKSHLNFLQSRINPHFLFNTLNMISSLARIENADQCAELMEIDLRGC